MVEENASSGFNREAPNMFPPIQNFLWFLISTRVSGWCLNFNFEWAYPLKCWCMFRVDIQKKSSSQSNWATTTCCKFSHEIFWPAVLLLVFQLKPKSDTPKDRVIRRKMAIGSSSDVCCFAQYHAIRWRARPIFGSLICSSHSLHR